MTNLLLTLCFLFQVAPPPAPSLDHANNTNQAVEVKDGLKFTIRTEKTSYFADEIVVLQATFTNVSDKPISISKYQLYEQGNDEYFTLGIVERNTGFAVVNKNTGGPRIKKKTVDKEFITISPNEVFHASKLIDLKEYNFSLAPIRIVALYYSYWNQSEVKEINNLWGQEKGILYTKPIEINISKR